ncbi:MAG: phosphoribosyltransferase family protein [Caulobacteraceae bacterium]
MDAPVLSEPAALLSAEDIARCVDAVAATIAPRLEDDAIAVVLLTGGLWFAADLTRALARHGRHARFDALWLTSYGDDHVSSGRCEVRAGLQRPVKDRQVLIVDDVFDSGRSLLEAGRYVREAGARDVLTVVFARKPWPEPRGVQPDFVAWEAPARYLVGYGLDDAGAWRGLPYVGALD